MTDELVADDLFETLVRAVFPNVEPHARLFVGTINRSVRAHDDKSFQHVVDNEVGFFAFGFYRVHVVDDVSVDRVNFAIGFGNFLVLVRTHKPQMRADVVECVHHFAACATIKHHAQHKREDKHRRHYEQTVQNQIDAILHFHRSANVQIVGDFADVTHSAVFYVNIVGFARGGNFKFVFVENFLIYALAIRIQPAVATCIDNLQPGLVLRKVVYYVGYVLFGLSVFQSAGNHVGQIDKLLCRVVAVDLVGDIYGQQNENDKAYRQDHHVAPNQLLVH